MKTSRLRYVNVSTFVGALFGDNAVEYDDDDDDDDDEDDDDSHKER